MVGVVGASLGPVPVSYAFDQIGDPVLTLRYLAILPLIAAVVAVCFLRTAPQVEAAKHLE